MSHEACIATRAKLETIVLTKLREGLYDGPIGGDFPTSTTTYCRRIIAGVPQHISIYPDGTKTVDKGHETEAEKLEFMRSAGWMMSDPDANLYSRLYRVEDKYSFEKLCP